MFLKEEIKNEQNPIEVCIDQISTSKLKKAIERFVFDNAIDENKFLIKSTHPDSIIWEFVSRYSQPISMRIYPLLNPVIGIEFDVFGILKSMNINYSISDEKKAEFYKLESEEVYKRVVCSLEKNLGVSITENSFFEFPYNKEKLRELISLYYKGEYPENKKKNNGSQNCFLIKQYLRKYAFYCAPKLATVHNQATDLPFFWCRGTECFHNSLEGQTLDSTPYWKTYSLYHLIEIIGYPKLKITEGGLEPDKIMVEFIAVANKVLKKFNRLKCRSCGHLLYTDKSSGYNRYNYYSCINPTCKDFNHPVYLSYCYKCKTGLIDSRDSKQCPNGWYICPTCHSCCNDAQYERLAQRYIIEKKPIPDRVRNKRGQSHNDKNIFFCHKCGTELQMVDRHGEFKLGCPTCKIIFDDEQV